MNLLTLAPRAALALSLAVGSFAAAPASAQNTDRVEQSRRAESPGRRMRRGHRGRRGHHGPMRMLRQLDLSENQQAQVRAIFESARERHSEIRELPEAERHAARRALHQETRGLVRDVLTPAQRQRAQQLREQHRERRFERMRSELELSDAQATQVQRIFEEAHQRRMNGEPPASREEARARHEAVRAELEQVLDAEQMVKLREMRDRHRGRHGRRGNRGPRGADAPEQRPIDDPRAI